MNPIYLRSSEALGAYPVKLTERLEHWASKAPDRIFLGMREACREWRTISYREFRQSARHVAQALLNRGLTSATPIAILSGNSIEHALLGIAAMYAGVPYAPISPNYSLLSRDFAELRRIMGLLNPQLVFAAEAPAFAAAIRAAVPDNVKVIAGGEAFRSLLTTAEGPEFSAAHDRITADTVAKILFTSGSTGDPKPVINTQRMLTSNQEMIVTAIPHLRAEPPVLCDWLPWHHTFGGNHNFGVALYNGGTLYIDEGRPTDSGMEASVRNLQEISPTVYFNVPRGLEMLATCLRADPQLARGFFKRLQTIFCAAASLPRETRAELVRLAELSCGRTVPILTGFGATETAPLALCSTAEMTDECAIGLPVPGVELKLIPHAGKLELYVRGPNVTPESLDNEGYHRTGDAVRFIDPEVPSRGLAFDGRLAEDFKLSSGTWVDVESLRRSVMACCQPHLQAVVIAGENQDYVAALLFPRPEAASDAGLKHKLEVALQLFARHRTNSRRIARAMIATEPLSVQAGEITGKESINASAVFANRPALLKDLYAANPPPDVIDAVAVKSRRKDSGQLL